MLWGYASSLDLKSRWTFESFANNVNNLPITSKSKQTSALFDLVFDEQSLTWVPIREFPDCNTIHISNDQLIVQTEDFLKYKYHIKMNKDYLLDTQSDSFNTTLIGDSATFKSTLLQYFALE
jgi:hypothetical protein